MELSAAIEEIREAYALLNGTDTIPLETIDAMGTQTAIAEKIREKRADYVLALKKNKGNLYEDVSLYLKDEEEKQKIRDAGNYKRTIEKAQS